MNQKRVDAAETSDLIQWDFPDSTVSSAAFRLADDVSTVAIHNHCVRSYLFARELAAAQGLRSGIDYDEETVFLSCILHDLGLTSFGSGDQRFEVEGADAATRFLRELGHPEDRVTTVWQTIALHTSVGLGYRFGTNHAVSHGGIDLDIAGAQKDLLPVGFADRVHAAWPRYNAGSALAEIIGRDTQANPTKAPPFSLPGSIHASTNDAPALTFAELIENAGWSDELPQK